ncbi:2-oxoglutarate ferredoxin oxidoreductase subunit beta [Methanolinea mesophila]|uniref:thiamine pyrophosphate-dependent enzyme n=1 Tax=Methanolinea mesophila TaxID=547055 RepID=UPI001AE3381A|nr:thiamine pyrophosphate-dependent enzyme [Methanolinea mesophila]MBP1929897.1 2-oxoglutarate ferredoxin oxidoreductase subunit beta [Methanolinea mesophila]
MSYEDWFREDRLPHIYCVGCGNGTVINCTLSAVDQIGWKREDTVFVSGIGCSSRAPGYILTDSLHTTHGRALAFATGVRMANKDLHVVVFTGDGDLAAIGGNHFIHACRRNIDITVVCMNNQIYGMTGGQGSPTTPSGAISTTTPYGSSEPPFDLCELAMAAGANYVSRWTSYHVKELTRAVLAGLETPGLSFIEALVQCPTNYGRRNKFRQVMDQVEYMRTHAMLLQKAHRLEEQGEPVPADTILVGEFARRNRPALGVRP